MPDYSWERLTCMAQAGKISGDYLVAQTLTSWNRIVVWLQNMDLLRRTNGLALLDSSQDAYSPRQDAP
jgi:hypothetical protein